jgi:hypothetical protein
MRILEILEPQTFKIREITNIGKISTLLRKLYKISLNILLSFIYQHSYNTRP